MIVKKGKKVVLRSPTRARVSACPTHSSRWLAASNRPNTAGASPAPRPISSSRWKRRSRVDSEGAPPVAVRRMRATWVAVRSGFSRLRRPPAPAPAHPCGRPAAAARVAALRTHHRVAANPAVQRLPRDPHLVAERIGMGTRGDLAHQLAALLGGQPRIEGRADQLIAEQPDRLRPLTALVLLQRHLLGSPSPVEGLPETVCRAGALVRITITRCQRQGRFVLQRPSHVAAASPRQQPTATGRHSHPARRHRAEQPERAETQPDRRRGGFNRGQHIAPWAPRPVGITTSTPASLRCPRTSS